MIWQAEFSFLCWCIWTKKIIYVSEQESSIFLLHFYRIGKSIFNLNCIYQLLVDNLKADKHELEWLLHEKPKNI